MTSFLLPPVLCYHSLDSSGSLISVSPELFAAHMNYLSVQGYRVLSMQEGLDLLEQTGGSQQKTVILTFDDGYENNYTIARPLLMQYGFNATFYIATGFVGSGAAWMKRDLLAMFPALATQAALRATAPAYNRVLVQNRLPYLLRLSEADRADHLRRLLELAEHRLMTWTQIAQLARQGFEVGDHTQSHFFLAELGHDDLLKELHDSRQLLESQIGMRVQNFCYPYGVHDNRVQQAVRENGYRSACTTVTGVDWRSRRNSFALRRIMMHEGCSLSRFREALSPAHQLLLAVKPTLSAWRAWVAKGLYSTEACSERVLSQ